jgi:hypothetical protein
MLVGAVVAACGRPKPDGPTATKEPSPLASTTASATPITSASVNAPHAPTLRFVPGGPGGTAAKGALFAIEGALLVAVKGSVSRIQGETLVPVRTIEDGNPAFGATRILGIQGTWPDGVDVLTHTSEGRAPEPTYVPLTGKGRTVTEGEGGSNGFIDGFAAVGGSTILSTHSFMGGFRFRTVRGPKLDRKSTTQAKAGCKPGEVYHQDGGVPYPALQPELLGGTPAGTLIAFGNLCEKREPSAEMWDREGKARIVPLDPRIRSVGWGSKVLPGRGDELFLYAQGAPVILRYHDGEFTPLPPLAAGARDAFFSNDRVLHVFDGQSLLRLVDGAWEPVGRFAFPTSELSVGLDGTTLWASSGETLGKLLPGPSVDDVEGCPTPFVYLSDVHWKNEATYSFPTTRKALQSFSEVGDLSLVEVRADGLRRLGVIVKSRAQGQAVIAHVKATMKDEIAKLLCFAPEKPRVIPLGAAVAPAASVKAP